MYKIKHHDDGFPFIEDGHYRAIDWDKREVITATDLTTLKQMVAFLNAQPLGYVVGPKEKLATITPQDRHEEDTDIDYYDTPPNPSVYMIDNHEAVYGIYIAPIN